ncbi:MAG: leucine-rich repeat domain-containing protein, partial [Promethearchaeota archaeon]
SNIKRINLSNNLIEKIPKSLEGLENLTHLDLSFNKIKEIPKIINQLTNLKYLNLKSNRLKLGFELVKNFPLIEL